MYDLRKSAFVFGMQAESACLASLHNQGCTDFQCSRLRWQCLRSEGSNGSTGEHADSFTQCLFLGTGGIWLTESAGFISLLVNVPSFLILLWDMENAYLTLGCGIACVGFHIWPFDYASSQGRCVVLYSA